MRQETTGRAYLVTPGGQDLLHGPVLRTRAGCRARVAALLLGQRARLAWLLRIEDPAGENLARALHQLNHKKRVRRTAADRSDGSDGSVGSDGSKGHGPWDANTRQAK